MSDGALALRLRPRAREDLDAIWDYTAETWGRGQAETYLNGLFDVFEMLSVMPEMARERTEFRPPVRLHPTGRHLVVYQVAGGALEVLRVLGARQDWQALLQALE